MRRIAVALTVLVALIGSVPRADANPKGCASGVECEFVYEGGPIRIHGVATVSRYPSYCPFGYCIPMWAEIELEVRDADGEVIANCRSVAVGATTCTDTAENPSVEPGAVLRCASTGSTRAFTCTSG